jgi:hypothetical protein
MNGIIKFNDNKNKKNEKTQRNFRNIEEAEEFARKIGYKFDKPIDKLIKNSETTRLAKRNKKKKAKKIPRRQNGWIIYLRDKSSEVGGLQTSHIAKMWKEEPQLVKVLFKALETMAKKKHIEIYG